MIWEIKPAERAHEAVAQLYQYATGYNLAHQAIRPRMGNPPPTPGDCPFVEPGQAWPRGFCVPIPLTRVAPGRFAVVSPFQPVPGVVPYFVIAGRWLQARLQQAVRRLRQAARRALERLRRLGREARETARRLREWLRELGEDLERMDSRNMNMWLLAFAVVVAIVVLIVMAKGLFAGLALVAIVVLIVGLLDEAERGPGSPPSREGSLAASGRPPGQESEPTVPVLTPEFGATASDSAATAGAQEMPPLVAMTTIAGEVPLPPDRAAKFWTVVGQYANTATEAAFNALVDGMERELDRLGTDGGTQPGPTVAPPG